MPEKPRIIVEISSDTYVDDLIVSSDVPIELVTVESNASVEKSDEGYMIVNGNGIAIIKTNVASDKDYVDALFNVAERQEGLEKKSKEELIEMLLKDIKVELSI